MPNTTFDSEQLVSEYLHQLSATLETVDIAALNKFASALMKLIENKNVLYICGNGGSAANAIHIANDFTFGINPEGNALNVEALSANNAVITCLGNDIGYENIFSHQLKVKAKENDILLVLSGSGNSQNIVNAVKQANELQMKTVGFLGFDGGKVKPMLNIAFHFDINDMQISEDTQIVLGHLLMKLLNQKLRTITEGSKDNG